MGSYHEQNKLENDMNSQKIHGVYGSYATGTIGGVMNALHDQYGLSITVIDNITFDLNHQFFYRGALAGKYEWKGLTLDVTWLNMTVRSYAQRPNGEDYVQD